MQAAFFNILPYCSTFLISFILWGINWEMEEIKMAFSNVEGTDCGCECKKGFGSGIAAVVIIILLLIAMGIVF